jgi:uncharacterized protein YndB with AHSA1/START domain
VPESSSRVALHKSVEISAEANEVWELICDWAGMMRWWLTAEAGGLPGLALVSCDLIGQPGSVPRTRRMTLGNGTVAEETIVYQNDKARRLTYIKADDPSVSGYVATTYVDRREGGGCSVHLVSMFDVSDPADRTAAAGRFEAVYAAMFSGYRRYFARDRA